ncbi:hypothetical protein [Microbacterium sp. 179-I 3D4 NHS]|uniref:hypothetical protein n=1 Tax=Microbacterium sp. 179-I 3D4 NHS TaxID=3142381 RepID=UPI00399FA550
MDRSIVMPGQVAVAQGHRVEVSERLDEVTGEAVIATLRDLETNVRYRLAEELPGAEHVRWLGRVLECSIVVSGSGARTELRVDATGPGAIGAKVALREADAAADAAKAEADRWGGADRPPPEEPERFW